MIPRSVKAPTIPIPFHKLLKVVAVVDPSNPQTKELLDCIRALNFEVEVTESFDRHIDEDTGVGAYIALVDGERREKARTMVRAVRQRGFTTPLWALADSHQITDLAVVGMLGEVSGFIYLGQQTPAFYAKQVTASLIKYGMSLLPPFFGGLMAYDAEATVAFDCPGHQGGQFYRKSPAGELFFKHFGESIFRNDLCNADVDLGDLLIHEGAALEAQRHAAHVYGADRTYFVLNGTSTSNKVVTGAVLKRGDLVLFDRNNHKSLHQGALVQGPRTTQGRATVPARMYSACDLRRHHRQRKKGAGKDRPPVRLRPVGRSVDRLQRVPPLVQGPQSHAAGKYQSGNAGALFHSIGT
jgi:ornithine decarboxylase